MNFIIKNGIRKPFKKGGLIFKNNNDKRIFLLYQEYLFSLGNKETTSDLKLESVYWFINYLNYYDLNLRNFNRENLYDYLNMCTTNGWSYTYQDSNKYFVIKFLNWCFESRLTKLSGNMVVPKMVWHQKTNIRSSYSQEELRKLLNAIDTNTASGKEDMLIISLICYLGLRISDVISLKLSDIDFNENTIKVIQNKTRNEIMLPLIEEIKYPLLDYLKTVRPQTNEVDEVFITNVKPYKIKNQIKSNKTLIKKYMKKAGIKINERKCGFHSLRHSFATSLLSEDTPLRTISTLMGHLHNDVTTEYLDIDISKLKELALEVPHVI